MVGVGLDLGEGHQDAAVINHRQERADGYGAEHLPFVADPSCPALGANPAVNLGNTGKAENEKS